MNKKVRKAVRTYLVKDKDIVVIKYRTEKTFDYYNIPGGKIEENETSLQASIREFKEETGINIISQYYKGNVIVDCPEMIFDFDIYIVDKYEGEPLNFEENYSMWMNIDDLLVEDKTLPSIEVVKYLNSNNIQLKIYTDENHKILKIENGCE